MNFNVFRGLLRGFKNTIVNTYDERLMLETEYDQKQCLRRGAIVQELNLASAVSGTIGLSTQLPANARVLHAGIVVTSAVTLLTATNSLSIGVTGSNSALFVSNYAGAATFAAAVSDVKPVPDTAARNGSAATGLVLTISNNTGATAGTNNTGTGSVRAHVLYEYMQLPVTSA